MIENDGFTGRIVHGDGVGARLKEEERYDSQSREKKKRPGWLPEAAALAWSIHPHYYQCTGAALGFLVAQRYPLAEAADRGRPCLARSQGIPRVSTRVHGSSAGP